MLNEEPMYHNEDPAQVKNKRNLKKKKTPASCHLTLPLSSQIKVETNVYVSYLGSWLVEINL